jgi:DMSO/TMAO reductase YedYZ molybdopterin-dependent catalytic subunit
MAEPISAPVVEAPPSRHRGAGAALGLLSGAVALGVAQLVAAVLDPAGAPVVAVGAAFIDATPEWLKSFAIEAFGTADKPVLLGGIVVVLGVAAVLIGVVSVTRPRIAYVSLGVLGAIGALAAWTRPGTGAGAGLASVASAVAGMGAYTVLRRAAGWSEPGGSLPAAVEVPTGLDRRRFLRAGVAAAGVAVVADRAAAWLIARSDASDSRARTGVPAADDVAPPTPAGADLGIEGVEPFITPNDRFYRIDTALLVPSIAADGWSLTIDGMVDRPLTLRYDELASRPLIERDVTIACVSNEVGGGYIGNARWIGVPLADLLDEVGVQPGSDQLVSRSTDGWTAGTPVAAVTDGRDAMLAIAMNGEPLPLEHGFPVRMIVPGLYGYVSATKWLASLELTTFDAFDPYWIQRGWAEQAPIKTQSRIDTPRAGARVRPGPVVVAGVAWAQGRGIDAVEVSVDDGAWQPATLAAEDTVDTWRQWRFDWDAPPGPHTIAVRATDGTGEPQTPEVREPFPDGATGHHRISVEVA